jgi:hypothetical protein
MFPEHSTRDKTREFHDGANEANSRVQSALTLSRSHEELTKHSHANCRKVLKTIIPFEALHKIKCPEEALQFDLYFPVPIFLDPASCPRLRSLFFRSYYTYTTFLPVVVNFSQHCRCRRPQLYCYLYVG